MTHDDDDDNNEKPKADDYKLNRFLLTVMKTYVSVKFNC